jgi:hypothetical protein
MHKGGCLEHISQHAANLTAERAGVAASLRAGGASSLLQPGDEGLEGEGLGKSARATSGRRSSRGDSGSGGRSNRCGDSVVLGGGRGSGSGSSGGGGSGGLSRGSGRGVAGARTGTRAGTAEESGTRHLVVGVVAVNVDLDTGVGGGVELVSGDTLGVLSAGTGDLQVDALGVVLGAVLLVGGVKSDDLVAENVVTRSDGAGDRDGPGQVVLDELGGSPLTILVANGVDLEELQVSSLSRGGVIDLGHVVDNGTDVRLGPGVPLDVNLSSGSDRGNLSTSCSILVASNLVHVGVHGGVNEAVVEALRAGPLDDLRSGGLVLERGVVGSEVGTVDLDVRKVTVGVDGGSNGAEDGSDLDLGRHVDELGD